MSFLIFIAATSRVWVRAFESCRFYEFHVYVCVVYMLLMIMRLSLLCLAFLSHPFLCILRLSVSLFGAVYIINDARNNDVVTVIVTVPVNASFKRIRHQ